MRQPIQRAIGVLLTLVATHASACLNTYEEDLDAMMYRGYPAEIAETIQRLEAENAKTASIETRNDLAVAYILAERYGSAIALLTRLEREHPGLSRTASNLGTALELSGQNREALRWIKEGIVRDPGDHQGTEWLHVKVLEAKVALEKDAAWLDTHSVLGIRFGDEARPRLLSALPVDAFGATRSLEETEKALDYQLKERLKFVSAPDPIVASLWRTRADIAYVQKSRSTTDYYLAAQYFGEEDGELMDQRSEQFRTDYPAEYGRRPRAAPETVSPWPIAVALSLVALLGAWWRVRRARRPVPGASDTASEGQP